VDARRLLLDLLIAVDKFLVDIGETRLPRAKRKVQRSASEEWLKVRAERLGNIAKQLRKDAALSARPPQKRRRVHMHDFMGSFPLANWHLASASTGWRPRVSQGRGRYTL